jgi:hypothetical protein
VLSVVEALSGRAIMSTKIVERPFFCRFDDISSRMQDLSIMRYPTNG